MESDKASLSSTTPQSSTSTSSSSSKASSSTSPPAHSSKDAPAHTSSSSSSSSSSQNAQRATTPMSDDALASLNNLKKKKRKNKKSKARKRTLAAVEEKDETPDADAEELRQTTLLLQEDRKRRKKVSDYISENVYDAHAGAGAGDDDFDDDLDGDRDSKKFLGSFSQELQRTTESARMEEFVAEQLRLRRLKEAGRDDLLAEAQKAPKKGAERKETLHDELYQIPDKYREVPKVASEVGVDQWLAGITEVELPIENKLKNIEETERAKQKLLEKHEAEAGKMTNTELIPRNFNSNFSKHHTAFLREVERKRKKAGHTDEPKKAAADNPGENIQSDGSRVPFASDERVFQRFMSRYRRY